MHSHAASGRKQKEGNHWLWDPDRPVNSKKSVPFSLAPPGWAVRKIATRIGDTVALSFSFDILIEWQEEIH